MVEGGWWCSMMVNSLKAVSDGHCCIWWSSLLMIITIDGHRYNWWLCHPNDGTCQPLQWWACLQDLFMLFNRIFCWKVLNDIHVWFSMYGFLVQNFKLLTQCFKAKEPSFPTNSRLKQLWNLCCEIFADLQTSPNKVGCPQEYFQYL